MMEDSGEESSSDLRPEEQHDIEEEDDTDQEDQDYNEMSMEELLKLQEDIGTKAFKQKVLNGGPSSSSTGSSRVKHQKFKRANKNRPSEKPLMRRPVPKMKSLNPHEKTKKKIVRDPRFDDLSGQLNLKAWKSNFKFLKDMRVKEKDILKKELKEEQDPQKKKQIKSVIQRMENQEREQAKRNQEDEVKRMEREQAREALRKGLKPKTVSAKNRKLMLKTSQFQQLKKENKLDKYMERKEKRQKAKERRRDQF